MQVFLKALVFDLFYDILRLNNLRILTFYKNNLGEVYFSNINTAGKT